MRDELAVPDYLHRAIDALRSAGVRLEPGLTGQERETLERELGFTFGPEHAEFLGLALPVGSRRPAWRGGDPEELRGRLGVDRGGHLRRPEQRLLARVVGRAAFGGAPLQPSERTRMPFWSELAEGFEDRDL